MTELAHILPDTSRSAAGRVALEVVAFAPRWPFPQHGITWRAVADDHIAVTLDVDRSNWTSTRGSTADAPSGVSARCGGAIATAGRSSTCRVGCEVHDERWFGAVVIPSWFSVGWWFGTERYSPFFRAEITAYAEGAAAATSAR